MLKAKAHKSFTLYHLEGDTTAVGFEGKDWREVRDEMSDAVESKVGKLAGRRVNPFFSSKLVGRRVIPCFSSKLVGRMVNPCFSSLLLLASSSSLSMLVRPDAAALEV